MKRYILLLLLIVAATVASAQKLDVDKQLDYCNVQIHRALKALHQKDGSYDYNLEPRNCPSPSLPHREGDNSPTFLHGGDGRGGVWSCRPATAQEWCGGFWPGILWMDYSVSKDEEVRKAAEGYTEALKHIAYEPIFDHDIGFLMFCSFGKGYEVNNSTEYKKAILASADSLATLFNPMVGTILSWPRNVKFFGGHNTIMDNMMNLDMMFWAAKNGGNPLLYDLAVSHAKTTMHNHFRPDGSCYHVAVYDSLDGHFIKGVTHQSYADSSMWARGQSWAIYGYTMVYRYTHNPVFLKFAEKVTDAYLKRLGRKQLCSDVLIAKGSARQSMLNSFDLIPAWDFDDPNPKASKDASAACVVADALIELSKYVGGDKGKYYHDIAVVTLAQLSTPKYLSGKRNVSFLMHSTGHHPAGSEIDYSIIYADYYYLEALIRLKNEKR